MLDRYKTLLEEIETTIVQKKSKFICNLIPVKSEEEVLISLQVIKKRHYSANHHCYAYIIIENDKVVERFNDDKEPSGTAGKPILEVLKGTGMINVLAVVTRYFGGVLLGTGGLIKAYTESVQASTSEANIYENILCEQILVSVDYHNMPKIEYEIHKTEQIIYHTEYAENVTMTLLVEREKAEYFKKQMVELTSGQCVIKTLGDSFVSQINGKYQIEE